VHAENGPPPHHFSNGPPLIGWEFWESQLSIAFDRQLLSTFMHILISFELV
jgi:hypothetical protein